jgi:hypothetical protein
VVRTHVLEQRGVSLVISDRVSCRQNHSIVNSIFLLDGIDLVPVPGHRQALGLSPAMGEKLVGTIQALQRGDLSVLIAESDVRRLHFADKIYTIEHGAIVHQAESEP